VLKRSTGSEAGSGDDGRPRVTLTAGDARAIARSVSAVNRFGEPRAGWNLPADHPHHDPERTGRTAAVILAELFALHAVELSELGAAPPHGPAVRPTDLAAMPPVRDAVSAVGSDFDSAVRRVMATLPGRVCWVDPESRQWRFADSAAGGLSPIRIGEGVAPASASWRLSESAEGAATALEAFGPVEAGSPDAGEEWLRLSDGRLRADWPAPLEATWTEERAGPSDPRLRDPAADALSPSQRMSLPPEKIAALADNPYAAVFRRFRPRDGRLPGFGRVVRLAVRTNPLSAPRPRWVEIPCRVDAGSGTVTADAPVHPAGDLGRPSTVPAAYDVALVFAVTAPAGGGVSGRAAPLLRFPSAGFAGTSAAWGLRSVRRVYRPDLSAASAPAAAEGLRRLHARLREPAVTGRAELGLADASAGLWEPVRRVALPAPWSGSVAVTRATLEFGPSPRWVLRLG
jgi:hypothetical protein